MVRVCIPATTANLGPGFDCLGLALNLYNEVELAASASWSLEVQGEGMDILPTSPDNLVWRAASTLWKKVGVLPPTLRVSLINRIPLSRGLGSSSAAIVGGLVAANSVLANPMSRERLLDIATEIEGHPDNVAPALYGGLIASLCEGDRVYARPLPLHPGLRFLACIPEFSLATSLARDALPREVPHVDAVFNVSRVVMLLEALRKGDMELLRLSCSDRLHQPYRKHLIPGYDDVAAKAYAQGAAAVMISGAGPTVLAITDATNTQSIRAAMESGFARHEIASRAIELTLSKLGATSL